MENNNEKWRPIKNYEGFYEVSSEGRIKSCGRVVMRKNGRTLYVKEKILKPVIGKYGRKSYTLSKDGVSTTVRGYRIVAETFIPNPNNYLEINHIDGDNLNDRVENLEWISTAANMQHAKALGLFNTYHKRKNNILKEKKVMSMSENSKKVLDYLKSVQGENVTAADVAEACGLDTRQVNGIFTSAIAKKELGVRSEPTTVELADGTVKKVRFLSLTDAGMNYVDAE